MYLAWSSSESPHMVPGTLVVEPQATLHAGCGETGEVKVYPAWWTVRIIWKRKSVHFFKQITSLLCAGSSRAWEWGLKGGGGVAGCGHPSLLCGDGESSAGCGHGLLVGGRHWHTYCGSSSTHKEVWLAKEDQAFSH